MDTFSLGVIRPPPGSCDERGKRPKSDQDPKTEPESGSSSEPEPESETDSETERELEKERDRAFGWQSIPLEDLEVSDLSSRYEDHPYPFAYSCPKFTYVNKAMRKQEEDGKKALADYRESSRNISPYDVTDVPSFGNICGNNFPRPVTITVDRRQHFVHLSKLALDKYNHDNEGIKYEFEDVIKATRQFVPLITYYITFQAKTIHDGVENCPAATTFQARVWDRTPSSELPVVESCSIKT
ncbi:uncharacterized protein LOC131639589 [Vicia villosa]|nr:uncharacterized protein LOC131639589 [Vicia villosa]